MIGFLITSIAFNIILVLALITKHDSHQKERNKIMTCYGRTIVESNEYVAKLTHKKDKEIDELKKRIQEANNAKK